MHAIIVIFFAGILLVVRLLLVINRREDPINNTIIYIQYHFIMLLHYDSCRSKWCRLCKRANELLTKYESNVFFVFVTCVFYNLA